MLYLKELKKVMCSFFYILFAGALAVALYSQGALYFGDSRMNRPEPDGNYGVVNREIPEMIMPAALESLWQEFCENNYKTYPIGFIKNVRLDEKKQRMVAEIIAEITGEDTEAILGKQAAFEGTGDDGYSFNIGEELQMDSDGNLIFSGARDGSEEEGKDTGEEGLTIAVRDDMEYGKFAEAMQRVDDILGGGSDYCAEHLKSYGTVEVTYEEAVQRHELTVSRDRITGGYARLFSDYAVAMVMSLLPVFPAVILCLKDRRARMAELIYTREVSAARLTVVRYFALVTAAMLPVLLLSYVSNASVWGLYSGERLDYLAPLKYDLGWIMPGVMMATAVGMFLTELTGTPIAVAVQGFWWLIDINMGFRSVESGYALFRLAPRHNAGEKSFFRTQDYVDNFQRLVANRLLFAGLSAVLIIATILIYERKRRGSLDGGSKIKRALSVLGNRKNKLEG